MLRRHRIFRVQFRRAFTLFELLVACGIVAILAGIVWSASSQAMQTGQVAHARSDLARISLALDTYRKRYGDFPRTDQAADLLQSLLGRRGPDGAVCDDAPLVDESALSLSGDVVPGPMFLDPWRRPYVYIYKVPLENWTNPSFVLCSLGPSGAPLAPLAVGGYSNPDLAANGDVIEAARN